MAAGLFKAPTINFKSTSLDGAIDDSANTISVNSATNLQSPGYIIIDREDGSGTATPNSREVVSYTGISSNDLTGCSRGEDGSTAAAHSDGALVETMFTIGMHNDQRDAINAEHDTDGTHAIISAATITQAWINDALLANATITTLDATTADITDAVMSSGASIVTLTSDSMAIPSGASVGATEFTINNSRGHLTLTPGASKFVRIAVLEQANHSSTVNTYRNNSIVLTGWGNVVGGDGTFDTLAITFGITFITQPIIVANSAGRDTVGAQPTTLAAHDEFQGYVTVDAYAQLTTGFTAAWSACRTGADGAQTLASGAYYAVTWIAVGTI